MPIVILLIILLVVLMPLAVIWALNTLFALSIAYTFWTWLAVLILAGTISPNISTKGN